MSTGNRPEITRPTHHDRHRRVGTVAAPLLIAAAVLFSGCTSTAQVESSDAAADSTADAGDTGGLGAIDAATLDALDERKSDFDDWMHAWRDAGCHTGATPGGDLNCATQLAAGHLVASAVAIEFGSLPDFGMGDETTERVASIAQAAEASGAAWIDGECPGAATPSCDALVVAFVDDLGALHEELLRWTR
jgi:hypothetical protein